MARGTGKLARCRAAKQGVRCNFEGYFTAKSSQKAQQYEHEARTNNAIADLYRQMDPQDSVFAEGAASSTRRVAPRSRKYLPANAYQNSSQSRIHWLSR